MDRFIGCTLMVAAVALALVAWIALIYFSNLLGAAVFG